ncbi:hypothetical protein CY35_18G074400 [Sphagnum magellanicum]|nr:hypothetical protein CY35_18G074400 [Sphagnum magellanicum]
MSQPRITVTIGRDGKRVGRRVSVTTDMYADRANGGNNTRKRSIRDRLGGNVEQLAPVRQPNTKRLREDDGKWKHDLYEDMEESDVQGINGQISSQDLRSKLARPNLRIVRLRKAGSSLGVMDLREKLSGSTSQRPPVSQAQGGAELQRRLPSVVRNGSNGAQTAPRAPAPLLKQTASVIRTPAAPIAPLKMWRFFNSLDRGGLSRVASKQWLVFFTRWVWANTPSSFRLRRLIWLHCGT